jgi:porphobilinogen synthase
MFPARRLRRLRIHPNVRRLVAEARVPTDILVYPVVVDEALTKPQEVPSLPGFFRWPLKTVGKEVAALEDLGLPAVLLFGVPRAKDEGGSAAYAKDGIVPRAIRAIHDVSDVAVVADLCLCGYTSHGHCGVLEGRRILNDKTLDLYGKVAVAQALAGADVIAPSGMMDGQVAAIRRALDAAGCEETPILAYSAKYASSLFAPFREAADSAPQFGDRRSHQMDPRAARQAVEDARLDVEEGADMVMVKPALPYLDVVRTLRDRLDVPVGAFQVSGEYAMIKAAAAKGWLDEAAVVEECLLAIRRAGADFVVTYFAKSFAAGRS